jgi:drug/metabolite transporter (DMT)-like permease
MAFVLFGERLDAMALAGMVLIAFAVALARRRAA